MIYSLTLLVGTMFAPGCYRDPVCESANQFRGAYIQWTRERNAMFPGTVSVTEAKRWRETVKAFDRLKTERKAQGF